MIFYILIFFTLTFAELNESPDFSKVYEDLKSYKESGKDFGLVLMNKQLVYASEVVELDSMAVTVNILRDRRMGQLNSFESLVKEEIENSPPKLLRTINLANIYAINEAKRVSTFNSIPYSPSTLIIIVPLIILFVKFISTMMVV